MINEYEVSILDINVKEIQERLEKIGATKKSDVLQRLHVYNLNKPEKNRWIRLRTDGTKTTLTVKDKRAKKEIGSVKELEIEISKFDEMNQILEIIGVPKISYQEKRRISYQYNDIQFEIDFWPMIPPYLEIEGKSKEDVLKGLRLLNISEENICLDTVDEIYMRYGINTKDYKVMKFDEQV